MELTHAQDERVDVADELVTTGVAARLAQLSMDTIRRAADSGKLPFTRTPGGQRRFRRGDVEALSKPAAAKTEDGAA